MNRKVLLLVILSFFVNLNIVNAQDIEMVKCEYSEEYIAWTKLSEEEQAKTQKPFMCKTVDTNMNVVGGSSDYTLSKFTLQDDYVLDVRNQEDSDTCWAFASLASIESNLLKNNINTDYLSIAHLELFNQTSLYKPSYITFNRNFNSGGYFEYTNSYVLNNFGPVLESTLNFQTILDIIHGTKSITASQVEEYKAVVDVDDIMIIQDSQGACSENSITTIKKYLVNYGALAAGINFVSTSDDVNVMPNGDSYDLIYKYLNGAYYYYDGSSYTLEDGTSSLTNELPNHAVTIVGWDDNVELDSFSTVKPSRKGAWIVKNSYGKSQTLEVAEDYEVTFNSGNEGYYYVSYDDINICTNIAGYFNTSKDVSDYAYYYDDLGFNVYYTLLDNTLYTGNVFSKKSSKTEKIDKITFANYDDSTNYTVYISQNKSFTNMQEIASGVTTHQGYISVIPDETIMVADDFSIIVKYEKNNEEDLIVPFSIQVENNSLYDQFGLTSNVSYVSVNGTNWADTTTSDLKAQNSVRVYTTEISQSSSSEVDNKDKVKDDADIIVDNNENNNQQDNSSSSSIENNNESNSNQNEDSNSSETKKEEDSLGDLNDVENPQTGIVGISIMIIVFVVIGIFVYKKAKNKIYKI